MIKPLVTSISVLLNQGRSDVQYSQGQNEPESFQSFLEQQQMEGEDGDATNSGQQQTATATQHQQQDPPALIDPFKDVEIDLLPQEARAAIERSRADLQRLQSEATAGRKFQSEVDKVKAEATKLRAELEARDGQQQQQQQQQQKEPTFEDQMRKHYSSLGLPKDQIDAMVRINAPIFGMLTETMEKKIAQGFAPVTRMAVDQHTHSAFSAAIQNDNAGWSRIPEISQAVWDRATQLAQQGEVVTVPMLQNLGKIFYVDHVSRSGADITSLQIQQQQQQQQPNLNHLPQQQQNGNRNQTNFTFPGAGNVATLPTTRTTATPLDADTQAAVAAVTDKWPKKGQYTGRQ